MTTQQQQANRLSKAGQWVRTGIVSASIIKPLVDAYQANRARKAPALLPSPKNPVEAALARIEEQIPLTQAQLDALTKAVAERLENVSAQAHDLANKVARYPARVDRRVWWATGIAVGFVAAGTTAFIITRRQLSRATVQEAYIIPAEANGNGNGNGVDKAPTNDRLRGIVNRLTRRNAEDTATESLTATALVTDLDLATQARYIGNIHTMIYHPKDSEHLPTEVNRVYFLTQAEAEAAGYRPAIGE